MPVSDNVWGRPFTYNGKNSCPRIGPCNTLCVCVPVAEKILLMQTKDFC